MLPWDLGTTLLRACSDHSTSKNLWEERVPRSTTRRSPYGHWIRGWHPKALLASVWSLPKRDRTRGQNGRMRLHGARPTQLSVVGPCIFERTVLEFLTFSGKCHRFICRPAWTCYIMCVRPQTERIFSSATSTSCSVSRGREVQKKLGSHSCRR